MNRIGSRTDSTYLYSASRESDDGGFLMKPIISLNGIAAIPQPISTTSPATVHFNALTAKDGEKKPTKEAHDCYDIGVESN